MNVIDIAKRLIGYCKLKDFVDDHQITLQDRNYLQRNPETLEDSQVYEMEWDKNASCCITCHTVNKRTAKYIYLAPQPNNCRGLRLPREPLETGDSVRSSARRFQLGIYIRPSLQRLVAEFTMSVAKQEAALPQRTENERRWGVAVTDQEFEEAHRLAAVHRLEARIATEADWIKEGF